MSVIMGEKGRDSMIITLQISRVQVRRNALLSSNFEVTIYQHHLGCGLSNSLR